VLAQDFDGFAMNAPKTQTVDQCVLVHKGVWHVMPQSYVPEGTFSGGACVLTQRVETADDKSYTLLIPSSVTFVFDHKERLEFAIFDFEFPTWSERDHARKSVKAHMNDYFPLTATRTDPRSDVEYRLNNLPYFFTFLEAESAVDIDPTLGTVYHLGLAISRQRMTTYSRN